MNNVHATPSLPFEACWWQRNDNSFQIFDTLCVWWTCLCVCVDEFQVLMVLVLGVFHFNHRVCIVQNSRWTHALQEKFISDFFFFSSLCSCCFQQILFYIHIYLDGSKFLVYLENARLLFACLKRWKCFLCFFFVFFAPLHLISCILFFWSASRIFDKMDYNRDRFELSETQRKWRERKKAERKVSKQSTGTFQQCIRTEAPEINVWEVMTIENDEVSRKV